MYQSNIFVIQDLSNQMYLGDIHLMKLMGNKLILVQYQLNQQH